MIGVQAQATFTETYTLTGKDGSDWSNILKVVPSDGLRSQNFEVAVNGTNGHLLVWGGTTDGSGVHYGDNWRDMAFRNVTIGDKVAFTISDATKLDQVKLNSNTDKVSYVDEGATRTFTVNQSGVSVLYLARATDNICVTQIQYTYQMPSGFTKVTSADDLNETNYSNNYYVFSAKENPHLVLRLNVNNSNADTDLDYQTQNVSENLEQLWTLEKNGDDGFSMRNIKTDHLLLQTEGNNKSYCIRLNDQPNVCEWTKLKAEAADGFFKIQNTKYSGNYLGLWTPGNDYVNDADLAGNKTAAAQIGHFNIYAIPRSTFNAAYASSHTDITDLLANPAVKNTTGWTNGRTGSKEQYTGAPDNTYLDNNSGTKNMSQDVNLPAGYYLLKCATRAATGANANVYAYSYRTSANIGQTANHKEGNSGNLLDRGWAWTYVPFTLEEAGKVGIGFWSNCSGTWAGADDFHLTYYTSELEMKQAHLVQVVADANAWAEKLTTTPSLEEQLSASAPSCSTVEECNTAITNLTNVIAYARATSPVYPEFVRMKNGANSIKDVESTDAEACATLASVITAQTAVAEGATTEEAITTATTTLRNAILTYVNSAEPKTDGEYFEITCLVANPDFANNNIDGWTRTVSSGGNAQTNYQCNEFWNNTFNFYQDLTGLPNGSYQLSVQAFCRPGANSVAYPAYKGGTNNAHAELYVNSDASTVGNIYAYTGNTTGAKVTSGTYADYECEVDEGDNYWVPNGMEGAHLYFEDQDVYKTEVAALVNDGNLRVGFRDETLTADQWTIFSNFRLYYYGSDKLVYYKQYLPQLKEEVSADLVNGAYANVLVSSEDEALDAALAAEPASETEEAYETVINNLKAAQAAFRAAAPSYDAMVAAQEAATLTKISTNIGTGVFQYNEATNNTKYGEYETAKAPIDSYTFTTSSTAAGAQALVDAFDDAVDAYINQTLNAPTTDTHYKLTLADKGALTYTKTGAADEGGYELPYQTAADYMAQTFFLNRVNGNDYTISFIDLDGDTRYICTGEKAKAGQGNEKIRTTTTAENALKFRVAATATANVFNLLNTESGNSKVGSNGGGMYTADTYASWSIAEASQAAPKATIVDGSNWATFMSPFSVSLNDLDGVDAAYTTEDNNGAIRTVAVEGNTIPANTPVLLYRESNSGKFEKDLSGWGTAAKSTYTVGLLTGSYELADIPYHAETAKNNYVLQMQGGVVAFYNVTKTGLKVGAYRAYLTMPEESEARAVLFFPENPTGINAVKAADAETEGGLKDGKYLIGNKIVLVKNGVKYDANGKKLN